MKKQHHFLGGRIDLCILLNVMFFSFCSIVFDVLLAFCCFVFVFRLFLLGVFRVLFLCVFVFGLLFHLLFFFGFLDLQFFALH